MSFWQAVGSAMDKFTPWARDIQRAEAYRDNPPSPEYLATMRDLRQEADAGASAWVEDPSLAGSEGEAADYWGGAGPIYEAQAAESTTQMRNERAAMRGEPARTTEEWAAEDHARDLAEAEAEDAYMIGQFNLLHPPTAAEAERAAAAAEAPPEVIELTEQEMRADARQMAGQGMEEREGHSGLDSLVDSENAAARCGLACCAGLSDAMPPSSAETLPKITERELWADAHPLAVKAIEDAEPQTAHQADPQYWPEPAETCAQADHGHEAGS